MCEHWLHENRMLSAMDKEQRLRKYDKGNIQVSAYLRWCCTKKVEAMVVSLGI